MSDINTAVADSLKVLDLKRPIREADISSVVECGSEGPTGDMSIGLISGALTVEGQIEKERPFVGRTTTAPNSS